MAPDPRKLFAHRTSWNLEENRLSRALAERRTAGKPILDLVRSNPTECGFTYEQQSIQGAFEHGELLRYQPDPRGMRRARQAIAAYYLQQQARVDEDRRKLTPGTSREFALGLRLLRQ